eukprot:m.10592 g.10592  ORF g.10592 m.10592 type:complete len:478 (-) comp5998_c0_seq1:31-1464(-)
MEQGHAGQGLVQILEGICNRTKSPSKCIKNIEEFGMVVNVTDDEVLQKYSPLAVCAAAGLCQLDCCDTPFIPEQIHIAAHNYSTVSITWVTLEATPHPTVMFGTAPDQLLRTASAVSTTYTKGGWRGAVHSARLSGLQPSTRYFYLVGDTTLPKFWSKPTLSQPTLFFTTATAPGATVPTRLAVIGDAGATDVSDMTFYELARRTHSADPQLAINFTLHIGDISYADGYEVLWDNFMRKIESVSAYAPYYTCPGNHEGFFNFTSYLTRFDMPWEAASSPGPMQYSFDYGNIHFLGFNSEGFLGLSPAFITTDSAVYKWIEQDLSRVNRTRTPWVVAFGHRPLYCVESNDDCTLFADMLRTDFEDLFFRHKVDLVLGGHRHNYQTMWPLYQNKNLCPQQSDDACFTNPKSPVYVIDGAAGNKEHLTSMPSQLPDWSRKNIKEYGYGMIETSNSTHLNWAFYASADGSLLDSFTIVKSM